MLVRHLFAVMVFLVAACGLQAADESSARELLDSVWKQHAFLQAAPSPVALDANFIGQGNVPIDGRFQLRWQSKDHWWSRVDWGPFQQIRIRNGEQEYTLRNYDFTPFQVEELYVLFGVEEESVPTSVGPLIPRTEQEEQLLCFRDRLSGKGNRPHELCIDAALHDLMSESWSEQSDQTRSLQFSHYAEMGGLRYARELAMFFNSAKIVSAEVTRFEPIQFDDQLLKPPSGAFERRKCADMKGPVAIKKRSINVVKHPQVNLQSLLSVTILADGSVGAIHVLQSGGTMLDEPAMSAIHRWKFKPAMCGSEPVVDDLTAEVEYHAFPGLRIRNMTPLGATTVTLR